MNPGPDLFGEVKEPVAEQKFHYYFKNIEGFQSKTCKYTRTNLIKRKLNDNKKKKNATLQEEEHHALS